MESWKTLEPRANGIMEDSRTKIEWNNGRLYNQNSMVYWKTLEPRLNRIMEDSRTKSEWNHGRL